MQDTNGRAGYWECVVCSTQNRDSAIMCGVCGVTYLSGLRLLHIMARRMIEMRPDCETCEVLRRRIGLVLLPLLSFVECLV